MSLAVQLEIEDVAYGGNGVARLRGKVCFVPGALPGETVCACLRKERGHFDEAELRDILSPSPDRIEPVCPLAMRPMARPPAPPCCPGCSYQHAAYDAEIRIKQSQFLDLLQRQAGVDPSVILPPVPSPLPLEYRNKMVLHAQRDGAETRLGYYAADNRTVVDVPGCPLAMRPLNDLLGKLRATPGFLRTLRDRMPVTFRYARRDGALWWRGRAGANDTWLVEDSVLGPVSVPRNSFYQMNPRVSDFLVERVSGIVRAHQPKTVVDLYCGVGVFALAVAASGAPAVVGVDSDEAGIQAAEYNARQRAGAAIRWVRDTAVRALAGLRRELEGSESLLIVDPPRTGLGRKLIRAIVTAAPVRIVYVSCAADTLARDVAWLKEAGYEVEQAQLFDMFPRTAHFESVTELRLTH